MRLMGMDHIDKGNKSPSSGGSMGIVAKVMAHLSGVDKTTKTIPLTDLKAKGINVMRSENRKKLRKAEDRLGAMGWKYLHGTDGRHGEKPRLERA